MVVGSGEVWIDELKFRELGKSSEKTEVEAVTSKEPATGEGRVNLAENPGFEEADPKNPSLPLVWSPENWNTSGGKSTFIWDDKVVHSGTRPVFIQTLPGSVGSWVEWYQSPAHFKPGKFYRMTAWMKAEDSTPNSGIALCGFEVSGRKAIAYTSGSYDRKKLTISGARIKVEDKHVGICFICRGGKAWFDDVEIVEEMEGGGVAVAPVLPPQPAGENLLKNPSFEETTSKPRYPVADWDPHNWTGKDIPGYKYKQDTSVSHSGNASMYSECSPGAKAAWVQCYDQANPSQTYQASVWLKGENLASYSGLCVDEAKVAGKRPYAPVSGTFDWKKVTIRGIKPDVNSLRFTIVNRGGKLWADDAELCVKVKEVSKKKVSRQVLLPKPKRDVNIIENPSGEIVESGKPVGWNCLDSGKADYKWGSSAESYKGKKSIFLSTKSQEKGYVDCALIAGKSDLVRGRDAVGAFPSTKYYFSFYLKGDLPWVDIGIMGWSSQEGFSKDAQDIIPTLRRIKPTSQWKRYGLKRRRGDIPG